MHVEDGQPKDEAEAVSETPLPDPQHARRDLLRLGALGAAAVVTVRPGMAQAAASALTCSIPVPDPGNSTKWIRYDGVLVSKNTKDSYQGPTSALKGVDVRNALNYGTSYPGYGSSASSA
ncbi:MAG: hypothetical protein JWR77_1681, partial [Rhizorhabdus sp.]|nr:hypothetical protein [Rhizorhabdus sp.]